MSTMTTEQTEIAEGIDWSKVQWPEPIEVSGEYETEEYRSQGD